MRSWVLSARRWRMSHVVISHCVPVRTKRTGTRGTEPNHQRPKIKFPIFSHRFFRFPFVRGTNSVRGPRGTNGTTHPRIRPRASFYLARTSTRGEFLQVLQVNPPPLAFDCRSDDPSSTTSPRFPFLAVSCLSKNKRSLGGSPLAFLLPILHLVHEKWLFPGPCQNAASHPRRILMASGWFRVFPVLR